MSVWEMIACVYSFDQKKKCGSLSSSLRAEILNSGDETRARTCGIVILLNGFVSSILRRRLRHSGLKFNAIGTA